MHAQHHNSRPVRCGSGVLADGGFLRRVLGRCAGRGHRRGRRPPGWLGDRGGLRPLPERTSVSPKLPADAVVIHGVSVFRRVPILSTITLFDSAANSVIVVIRMQDDPRADPFL